jgi:RNA polymerase sigma-70 factor, ECF subfamily
MGLTVLTGNLSQNFIKEVPAINDETALALAAKGDQEAFGVLYERYIGKIYSYIYYRVGNHSDAEDLTARVFLRAYCHVSSYTDRGVPISAWLYRIAHNLVANWYRDNNRRRDISLEDYLPIKSNGDHPEATLLHNEESERLLSIIRTLPPDRQQLIILKFVEHYSNAEIGKVMGKTEGAVKSLYHRTLLSLRGEFAKVIHDGYSKSEGIK